MANFGSIRVGFPSENREMWAGGSCCAAEAQFPSYLCYTSANHLTQWSVLLAGAPNTLPLPPLLPVLASISGELKSCFMDGIHGGRCSLITAALHVLLGTDCTARHSPPQHQTIPIWGCLEYSVVKISRQMQISHSADTMVQSYKCHCNFSFSFFFYPAAYEMCLFWFRTQQQTTEQLWGKFSSEACFCSSCMWPEKVSRVLDSGFHLSWPCHLMFSHCSGREEFHTMCCINVIFKLKLWPCPNFFSFPAYWFFWHFSFWYIHPIICLGKILKDGLQYV